MLMKSARRRVAELVDTKRQLLPATTMVLYSSSGLGFSTRAVRLKRRRVEDGLKTGFICTCIVILGKIP